jgi:hypothetical protein
MRISGFSEAYVRKLRTQLVADGLVRDGGHGRWIPAQETT